MIKNPAPGLKSLLLLTALALLPSAVSAQERAFGNSGCTLRDGDTGIVTSVIDPVTVRLGNGLVVRLASLLPAGDAERAIALLETLLIDREVSIRYSETDRNRYEHAVAHVFVDGRPEGWVQSELLLAGYAIVAGHAEERSCLTELLSFERIARANSAGVWSSRTPLSAWSPLLRDVPPRFELVEGRVVSLGRTDRTIYLNFGNDWSVDLTVTIRASDIAEFETNSVTLDELVGREVRIRGWLEQWDGPWIKVDHPEQIEVLNSGDGGVGSN
ncbi:MAG: thermonuclease family protein [Alphaproteobacteria bacterium]